MWPQNKKFALCLTHDVDKIEKTYQYFTHFVKTGRIYHLKSFLNRENPYWCFEQIIKLEKKLGVKSTFFFMSEFGLIKNYNVNIVKKIIRKLDKNGWEIGLHGSFNSYKNKKLLKKEKEKLEQILGHKIIGTRQHYLNMDENTWKMQKELGFEYDASYGFTKQIGFKNKKYKPFKTQEGLLVIPLTIMDTNLKNILVIEDIIRTAKKKNALITIVWHQRIFNDKEFPGVGEKYEQIIKMCKSHGAWITNCKGVYDWMKTQKMI